MRHSNLRTGRYATLTGNTFRPLLLRLMGGLEALHVCTAKKKDTRRRMSELSDKSTRKKLF